ncbi:MAG TPA: hypothetical protein PKK54_02855 [bacterium]|jgi:hypothetical protein|nr:hypothetical protein [bacterium]
MLKKILNIIMRIAKGWILFPLTALILVLKLSNDMFEAIMNIFVKRA